MQSEQEAHVSDILIQPCRRCCSAACSGSVALQNAPTLTVVPRRVLLERPWSSRMKPYRIAANPWLMMVQTLSAWSYTTSAILLQSARCVDPRRAGCWQICSGVYRSMTGGVLGAVEQWIRTVAQAVTTSHPHIPALPGSMHSYTSISRFAAPTGSHNSGPRLESHLPSHLESASPFYDRAKERH